jgi:hypothetical protein
MFIGTIAGNIFFFIQIHVTYYKYLFYLALAHGAAFPLSKLLIE